MSERYSSQSNDSRGRSQNRSGASRGGFHRGTGSNHGGKRGGKFDSSRNHNNDRRGNTSYSRHRDFHKDDESGERRRSFHRDSERRGFSRNKDDRYEHRSFKRGENSRDYHGNKSDHRYQRRDSNTSDRRYNRTNQDSYDRRENKGFQDGPRRNSDGTLSFPSQNPYTHRRSGEPKMPAGMEWSMLSKDDKQRLRGLSKEHAENIGLHILAAYALESDDIDAALAHAQWVAKQASRIDIARETLAFLAYRSGDYKTALKEFRTAYRMNGEVDYLPFIADCERGLSHPNKAIEVALSPEAKKLTGDSKAEMMLVFAGAYADVKKYDQAISIVQTLSKIRGLSGGYRMRALQAQQNFLYMAGKDQQAEALDDDLERLEDAYADPDINQDEEEIVDNDLEDVTDDILRGLGINPHDFSSSTVIEKTTPDSAIVTEVDDAPVDSAVSPQSEEVRGEESHPDPLVVDHDNESKDESDSEQEIEQEVEESDDKDSSHQQS